MAFLDNRIKDTLNKINVKKLTNTPKITILIFLIIMFGLILMVIMNADRKTREDAITSELKTEETEEYDDKFIKNQADLLGYDFDDKPKNLKKEDYEKIFADDSANIEKKENLEEDFFKQAGISPEDNKTEILSLLEERINLSKNTPPLPVLILLDKNTNMYGVAGSNEKYPSGLNTTIETEYLTPEQKQTLQEKKLEEAQTKYQEYLNALKSTTKVYDNSNAHKNVAYDKNEHIPSYADNLKTALEYTNAIQQKKDSKPADVLDDSFTLNTELKKQRKGEIKTGFVIPATLLTQIESALRGMVVGQVRQSVYDTATGNILLIPQGTKIIGDYQSDVQYGAKRLFISWKRLVFPNGSSLDLSSMPGADMSGTSGFGDKYNSHFWKMFGNSLLFSLVIAGVNMTQTPDLLYPFIPLSARNATNSLSESVGQSLGETLSQIIQKNLNLAPDITIRSGYLFNIMITKDFVLPEYTE